MTQQRKATAWKKNKKFGNIYGGRMRQKCDDGIIKREHSLLPPAVGQTTPIYIVENPSRDFYFPVTVAEIKVMLDKLPKEHTKYLTHIWLDKVNKKEYLNGKTYQGEFICGSKVYLIKLYAVPKDNRMLFGKTKPTTKELGFYKEYSSDLRHDKNGWYLQFTSESYKRYYLERLLLHEIGYCVDYIYQRYWSKANHKQTADFSYNYAVLWSNNLNYNYDQR